MFYFSLPLFVFFPTFFFIVLLVSPIPSSVMYLLYVCVSLSLFDSLFLMLLLCLLFVFSSILPVFIELHPGLQLVQFCISLQLFWVCCGLFVGFVACLWFLDISSHNYSTFPFVFTHLSWCFAFGSSFANKNIFSQPQPRGSCACS